MITADDVRPGVPLRVRMNTGCIRKGDVLFVCEGTAGRYVGCSEGEHYLFEHNFCEFELAEGPW